MLYLGLGSNMGDKRANLLQTVALIGAKVGRVVCLSRFYETEPWGYASTNTYLNAALGVETKLSPFEVLSVTQDIERELGRTTKSTEGGYADRPIDIDILLMGEWAMRTANLTIPHPLMHERLFVLEPLVEIAPTVVHPVLGKTICQLYNALKL
jgi:2-amino-4-hydroxy-6-hydroxymethyldihydropteridine diphosphokinase